MDYFAGHSSFYHNVHYKLNVLSVYLIYELILFSKNRFELRLNVSPFPYVGYLLKSHAKGDGWRYGSVVGTDENGNEIVYLAPKSWSKDEHNTTDIKKFSIGGRLGINAAFAINENLFISLSNNYCFVFSDVLNIQNSQYTGIRSFDLKIGLIYRFEK
ncbi:hypothetical protein LJC11_04800 [Bacteroidales bacterium OttesenSCG-928-I21]|nr:hypothetical protein [Bacteroidales bacterium OttesenSCG-928-I21]